MSTDTTEDTAWDARYTPAYRAKNYLSGLASAFADGVRPDLDGDRCGGGEFPDEFARLCAQRDNCLNAAGVINARYEQDWDTAAGALTVIAPKVRETALSELRAVWNTLCCNYITETLDRDRQPFDCTFCGEPVDLEDWEASCGFVEDRCPSCMCILWLNETGTDWA